MQLNRTHISRKTPTCKKRWRLALRFQGHTLTLHSRPYPQRRECAVRRRKCTTARVFALCQTTGRHESHVLSFNRTVNNTDGRNHQKHPRSAQGWHRTGRTCVERCPCRRADWVTRVGTLKPNGSVCPRHGVEVWRASRRTGPRPLHVTHTVMCKWKHVFGGHQTLAKRRQPTKRRTTTSPWSTMMMAAFRRSRQRHDGSDDRVTK